MFVINTICVINVYLWVCFPLWMLQPCNVVEFMLISPWMYFALWMLWRCNAVGLVAIFRWMYFAIKMPLWCNAVGVVLLIAQGWRGTSLPWVSIRKGIQRCKCWVFLRKQAYNEDIHGGLRLESVTPMVLKHLFYSTINANIRIN